MNTKALEVTGVVERMLDHAVHGRWQALEDVLRMNVTFTARSTGRSVTLGVLEVLEVAAGRVRRSEVFLADTAALLAALA